MQYAITVKQPYASAIALGIKEIETRHFQPRVIGIGDTLLIHAGKSKMDEKGLGLYRQYYNYFPDGLPYGVILCEVKIVDIKPTDEWLKVITKRERDFGDYRSGRYGWKLEVTKRFEVLTPMVGKQGLWKVGE